MEKVEFKDLSTKDKIDELYEVLKDTKKQKIKLPRKARVSGRKQKQGYIGILYIDENGNIYGEKQKLDGSVFKENKAIRYHATNGKEILFWEGKFPVVLQPRWKINPLEIRKDKEKNETYGQPYIMARMLKDMIVLKKKGGLGILAIVGIIIGGYIVYKSIFGG
ncbi:MAG TPA: hypothetical protein ENG48_09220 [Candidatus Atribacteria bacterium]|nr:hypothetical protein [Candidatus Atribacteria bacterium]